MAKYIRLTPKQKAFRTYVRKCFPEFKCNLLKRGSLEGVLSASQFLADSPVTLKRLLRAERQAASDYKAWEQNADVWDLPDQGDRVATRNLPGLFMAFGLRVPLDWDTRHIKCPALRAIRESKDRTRHEVAATIAGIIERMQSYPMRKTVA